MIEFIHLLYNNRVWAYFFKLIIMSTYITNQLREITPYYNQSITIKMENRDAGRSTNWMQLSGTQEDKNKLLDFINLNWNN